MDKTLTEVTTGMHLADLVLLFGKENSTETTKPVHVVKVNVA